ncbi:MAG TPA: exosortase/archaeosortase family protein [Terriglobia bacterium]|nr:exosortase/archaeosortase family protein [Terriglobia bacterium]
MISDSPQISVIEPAPPETHAVRKWLWPSVVLAAVLVYLYANILHRLVGEWWSNPNFSHGFFVPPFAAFLIWKNRDRLKTVTVRPSLAGLAVIAFGLMLLVVGVLGAELFLSRTSFLFVLAGLLVYFKGWKYFRVLFFPWLFLFLMVPPPTLIMNHITIPLQFVASDLATWLLRVSGVPVLQNGNVIQLPNMALDVVEACSGIRSLISLGVMAIIYGYLLESSNVLRALLAFAAIPIAVIANGLRIMGTGLTGLYWEPSKAQGFFHEFSGWVIFVVALATLYLFHHVMRAVAHLLRRSTA